MARTLNVRITGVVQGVGYRAWAEQAARARGLSGWVRNRRDGSVEAVISGADDKGPGNSRVERVDSQPAPAPMQLGFRTLPTA